MERIDNYIISYYKGLSITRKYTAIGIIIGCLLPFVAWYIELNQENLPFTIQGLIVKHSANKILYVIDLAPLVFGFLVYIFSKKYENDKIILEKNLNEKNETIQRNAHIAKMIGEKDFSISIADIPQGDELGKSLLLMRNNLAETNKKEAELNWIAKGKEKISNILRLHNNIETLAYETLVSLINYTKTIQGSFYIFDEEQDKLINIATYAYNRKKFVNQDFKIGQGLIGQAAYEMDIIYRKEIPHDYVTITSGILGDKKPATLLIVPLISDEKLQGIIEFASLDTDIPELSIKFVKELSEIIAQTIFNLKVNKRTEKLLRDAQKMTQELRRNEEKLKRNALEMKKTQEELQKSNENLARQIEEVERAQKRLHSLLENASEVISIYDEEGIVKYESPSVRKILGYNPDEIVGKNAFEQENSLLTNISRIVLSELIENPEIPKTIEFQYKRADEEYLWLETTGRNLLNNPAIGGIIFNTRDITVRKIAEKAQRMSGQMQALSENSPDMIIRIGIDGKFFYVNPMVEKYTGVITNEIIRKNIDEVALDPSIVTLFLTILTTVKETFIKIDKEVDFPTIDGMRIMLINAIPEFSDEKELETVLIVAHDITVQKQIELEIKDKNKKINDSINYAKRIQSAILPDSRIIREHLPNSFIFYKPRDVVSGDFPWFFVNKTDIYIAAVDCTGHGVPGALLSFIGYFLLNNIVDHDREDTTAGKILDLLHQSVRTTLKQDREENDSGARDGMDIALCKINIEKQELQYAGAHRPLYFLRGSELTQYSGSPKSIGGIPPPKKEEKDFKNHVVQITKGDKVFFFSDGLPDQLGGDKGRKYQAARVRQQILNHANYNMNQYARMFARDFTKWKGDLKQIDDVLLIGIEFE